VYAGFQSPVLPDFQRIKDSFHSALNAVLFLKTIGSSFKRFQTN